MKKHETITLPVSKDIKKRAAKLRAEFARERLRARKRLERK